MLEDSEDDDGKSVHNQSYAAIMDEDDKVIKELSKIHGRNHIIDIPSVQRNIFCKVSAVCIFNTS